jgi:hypothetical protein
MTKGIKWAQILTMMNAIADTIVNTCATKTELQAVANNWKVTISGSTLILPSTASISGSTLILPA